MNVTHIYDNMDYHMETVDLYGLSEDHAANHTVVFLRWLIEQDLLKPSFAEETASILEEFRTNKVSIHEVYMWYDGVLCDIMLSEEGNKFAMAYFDFERGQYLQDYVETLQGQLPSEFHIEYTEENYQRMKRVIDRRYQESMLS